MFGGLTTDDFLSLPVGERMRIMREDERRRELKKPTTMIQAEKDCQWLST